MNDTLVRKEAVATAVAMSALQASGDFDGASLAYGEFHKTMRERGVPQEMASSQLASALLGVVTYTAKQACAITGHEPAALFRKMALSIACD